uniref:RecQ-mediated genome instability protein 1 n=1 Tax=Kalanchoe fedtschenkoi TaxID=63787 RepID=A0A7N0U830_KALFE
MSRRRLRLNYSDEDEEEEEEDVPRHQPHHLGQQMAPEIDLLMQEEASGIAAQIPSSAALNPNPNDDFPSPPLEISDDDDVFIDVSDNLSPPSPEDPVPAVEAVQPPPAAHYLFPPSPEDLVSADEAFQSPPAAHNLFPPSPEDPVPAEAFQPPPLSGTEEGPRCPVREVLKGLGLRLRAEWVSSCLRGLESSVSGFGSFGVDKKAEICFGQFLLSDMNYTGSGVLPENVGAMHLVDLDGPFVLQVDEIVNISCPLRQRYQKAAPGSKRCLKLSMTDGVQHVYGMEYRPIKDIDVLAASGLKVAIHNVHVRHGLLMLVPEVIEILGGMVEELEAAHQRLVTEISKPPRGRRPRMGDVPPLATRATLAAWPSTVVNGNEQNFNTRSQNAEYSQTTAVISAQDHALNARSHESGISQTTTAGVSTLDQTPLTGAQAAFLDHRYHHSMIHGAPPCTIQSAGASGSGPGHRRHSRSHYSSSLQTSAGAACDLDQSLHTDTHMPDAERTNAGIHIDGQAANYFSNDASRETDEFNHYSSNAFIDLEEDIDMIDDIVETVMNSRNTADSDRSPSHNGNIEDAYMHNEVENPLMLAGDREIPFTYLASLSAKLSAAADSISSVQGKIKCFMTGVKGFQYKERSTYELRAYVDDGSLISEILIDHNVVLNKIGYSPMEVNAAISSSDASVVSRMKEIIKQFQSFLINFEGTMVVELRSSSPTPVAIEMNQGCPSSDAWLLLRRVKT